jgi:hypothetical protein
MPSPSPATSAHSCHSCPDLNIDHEGCSPDGFRIGTFGSPYNDMGELRGGFCITHVVLSMSRDRHRIESDLIQPQRSFHSPLTAFR